MNLSPQRLEAVLQSLLDFLGTPGIVNEKYSKRRDEICKALWADIKKLREENDDLSKRPSTVLR